MLEQEFPALYTQLSQPIPDYGTFSTLHEAQSISPFVKFLSPPVQFARWAHMRRFLSVCLSVCLSICLSVWTRPKIRLENNSFLRKYYSY